MMIAANLKWAGAAEKREQPKVALKSQQNDSKLLKLAQLAQVSPFASFGWSVW